MPITYRPATLADSFTAYQIFEEALADLSARLGVQADQTAGDPQAWPRRRPLFEHLAGTAEHFWLAEADGQAIGYARSIWRDGTRELTEFFVRPRHQSGGVGRELLARAFPAEGARHRSIIATTDARALGRYLRAGVYPRFPIYQLVGATVPARVDTDLEFEPMRDSERLRAALHAVDLVILAYRRDEDHAWLQTHRQGFVYRRDGQVVGYGYAGRNNGPMALLDARDFPAVLAHAQSLAHDRGDTNTGFELPMINRAAVDYLLACGYKLDEFFAFYMSDTPAGKLENYVVTSPPFFL